MTVVDVVKIVTDLGNTGVLLLVLWQGLKRFDLLLQLVITLASRASMTPTEIEDLRQQVYKPNGKTR